MNKEKTRLVGSRIHSWCILFLFLNHSPSITLAIQVLDAFKASVILNGGL